MSAVDALLSSRSLLPKSRPQLIRSYAAPTFTWKQLKYSHCSRRFRTETRKSLSILCDSNPGGDDFISRVLNDNPSQVEPKYRIGDKFYTLKEKESLNKNADSGGFQVLRRNLNWKAPPKRGTESDGAQNESDGRGESVYLKDLLREYKGKLYVPEQAFGGELSEEDEFDRNLEELPKMSFDDFRKAVKSDKVKLLTSKETTSLAYGNGYRDFVVDLKEIPGDKSLHRTRWYFSLLVFFFLHSVPEVALFTNLMHECESDRAMKLNVDEVQALVEEYKGPQYEIERQTTVR